MIDFSKLTMLKAQDADNSYVGLLVIKGNIHLKLPLGFENIVDEVSRMDPKKRFNAVKNIYFLLYRVFKVYAEIGGSAQGKLLQDAKGTRGRKFGRKVVSSEIDKNSSSLPIFSHLDNLSRIMESQTDSNLQAASERISSSAPKDYKNISKMLGKAIYDQDNVCFIQDDMVTGPYGAMKPSAVVDMCCYILSELLEQFSLLVPSHISAMARGFRDKYLHSSASLFSFDNWEKTRNDLRDILEEINRSSPVRGREFLEFYEAANSFLNGAARVPDEEKVWGMTGFSHVWEAACIEYAQGKLGNVILADMENIRYHLRRKIEHENYHDAVAYNINPMKPDIVWVNGEGKFNMSDAKYKVDIDDEDIDKQITYDLVMARSDSFPLNADRNEFLLPSGAYEEIALEKDVELSSILRYLNKINYSDNATAVSIKEVFNKMVEVSGGRTVKISKFDIKVVKLSAFDVLSYYVEINSNI